MFSYQEKRNEEIKKLHKIYCSDFPDFLNEFIECEPIQRLGGVGQHCGTEYVKFPMFNYKYFYSRLDHSIGVAHILWNFTKDKGQTISGFLHDISSTVFAHVGDFLKKDYLNQEKTELNTYNIINNAASLVNLLSENKLSINQVADYKVYPIADNKSPLLSSDRLECVLHYPLIRGKWTLEDIAEVYSDITVLKNEAGVDELGFNEIKLAEKLSLMSIVNGRIDSSNEDKLCMQFLADILELMIGEKVISEHDLYFMTEKQIISLIDNCNIDKIKNAWKFFKELKEVRNSPELVEGKYCISLEVKKRYIDPLVKTSTGLYRISQISQEVRDEIEDFKAQTLDKFAYIDYKL